MKTFRLIAIIILIFVTTSIVSFDSCYAHIIDSKKIQVWKNLEDNLEIQFDYKPEKPIIDTFTNLEFSVTNLQTREHIRDFVALVTVTNGQRLFKFQNITVQNGDFSVDYIFPDDGTHQVLLRIDRKDSIQVASFQVFVPHQSPPSILNPFPSTPGTSNNDLGILASKILAISLPAAAVGAIVVMLKRKITVNDIIGYVGGKAR